MLMYGNLSYGRIRVTDRARSRGARIREVRVYLNKNRLQKSTYWCPNELLNEVQVHSTWLFCAVHLSVIRI